MRKTEEKAKKFYDRAINNFISRFYLRKIMDGYYAKRLASRMIAAGEIKKEDAVVDVASGMGGFLIELSNEINFEHPLIGIELSPQMAEFSIARIKSEEISNIKIIEGSAIRLSDYVKEATVVTSSWMLKYLDKDDLRVFFNEVKRVLLPGGKFLICEFGADSKIMPKVFKSMGVLRTTENVAASLRETGFVDVQETSYAKGHIFPLSVISLSALKP